MYLQEGGGGCTNRGRRGGGWVVNDTFSLKFSLLVIVSGRSSPVAFDIHLTEFCPRSSGFERRPIKRKPSPVSHEFA